MALNRIETLCNNLEELENAVPFLQSLADWPEAQKILTYIDSKLVLYQEELFQLLKKYMKNLIIDEGSDYYEDNFTKLVEDVVNDCRNPYLDSMLNNPDSKIWELPVEIFNEN